MRKTLRFEAILWSLPNEWSCVWSSCTLTILRRVNAGSEMADDSLKLYTYIQHDRGSNLSCFTGYSDWGYRLFICATPAPILSLILCEKYTMFNIYGGIRRDWDSPLTHNSNTFPPDSLDFQLVTDEETSYHALTYRLLPQLTCNHIFTQSKPGSPSGA
jgi:hypothetical protein